MILAKYRLTGIGLQCGTGLQEQGCNVVQAYRNRSAMWYRFTGTGLQCGTGLQEQCRDVVHDAGQDQGAADIEGRDPGCPFQ